MQMLLEPQYWVPQQLLTLLKMAPLIFLSIGFQSVSDEECLNINSSLSKEYVSGLPYIKDASKHTDCH